MNSMGRSLLIWLDYTASVKEGPFAHWAAKSAGLALVLTLGGSIGYSRLLLGVHSLDQVIYGWLLGVWFACTFHFIMRDYLFKHFNDLIGCRIEESWKYVCGMFAAWVTLEILAIIQYNIDKMFIIPTEWIANITAKCGRPNLQDDFQV